MPRRDRVIVHIVSADERVRQAGRDLPEERFDVTFAANAQEALSEAMQDHPEVAVIELHVGDFGGFALAKELRDIPGMAEFRLIMLCDRPHDRWLCRQAGAAEVIVKPIADPSELLNALDAVLLPTG
jgi:DNA-binding response OmpR family regulator